LVINDGQIVERGTHEELIRRNGKYSTLWSKQLSRDANDSSVKASEDGSEATLVDIDSGAEQSQ
jgi:hypothetical protein